MDNNLTASTAAVSQESKFPIVMIFSKWSLSKLASVLTKIGNGEEPGLLKIVFDKGQETDRTIALISDSTYDALCAQGFSDRQHGKGMIVSKFSLKETHFPGDGRTGNLFIQVPPGFKDDFVLNTISQKLTVLSDWGIIPKDSWSVHSILKSRESSEIRGGSFITFTKETPIDCIAMTRILLNETYWPDIEGSEERVVFNCFWARAQKQGRSEHRSANSSASSSDAKFQDADETTTTSAKPVKKIYTKKPYVKKTPSEPAQYVEVPSASTTVVSAGTSTTTVSTVTSTLPAKSEKKSFFKPGLKIPVAPQPIIKE